MQTDGLRPLAGVRVMSLAEQFPGPYATMLLADLGADVVMVERPSGGDPMRRFPGFFESLNRNKRSLALNLKDDRGRAAALRLAEASDVLIEGFRPGTVGRLGLSYAHVKQTNPRLIYVSVSGFGQDGPYRDRPAHDVTYQAVAGMLDHLLESADGPLEAPVLPAGDLAAAMFAVEAILLGLFVRERQGQGTFIDVSMTDALVSWMTPQLVPRLNRTGLSGVPYEPAYGLFPTADGRFVSLSLAYEEQFWQALCDVTALAEFRHLGPDERHARRSELRCKIAAAFAEKSLRDWERTLETAGVPFGPVNSLDEVSSDPQIEARELFVELPATPDHPARVHVRQPLRIPGFASTPTRHSPELGQHTVEVLREIGLSDREVGAMLTDDVVRVPG